MAGKKLPKPVQLLGFLLTGATVVCAISDQTKCKVPTSRELFSLFGKHTGDLPVRSHLPPLPPIPDSKSQLVLLVNLRSRFSTRQADCQLEKQIVNLTSRLST